MGLRSGLTSWQGTEVVFLELEILLIPYMTFFFLVICAYMQLCDGEDTLCEMAHENRRGDGGADVGGWGQLSSLRALGCTGWGKQRTWPS